LILFVRTNLAAGVILIADLGFDVPAAGGTAGPFTDDMEIQEILASADLSTLTQDGAFPGPPDPSSHSLIVNIDGVDVPPGQLQNFGVAVMVGATGALDGQQGVVPKPLIADQFSFLRGDATWQPITAAAGLVTRPYAVGVAVRDVVYQRADGFVDRANAGAVATSAFLVGFVETLDSPGVGFCQVRYAGDIAGFAGLTVGDIYILSTLNGQIVRETDTGNPNYPSTAVGSGNTMVEVGVAVTATSLFVETSRDFLEF
jgi:hypothetical protein